MAAVDSTLGSDDEPLGSQSSKRGSTSIVCRLAVPSRIQRVGEHEQGGGPCEDQRRALRQGERLARRRLGVRGDPRSSAARAASIRIRIRVSRSNTGSDAR